MTTTLVKTYSDSPEVAGEGIVEGLVSAFNNVDLVGDRVMPGAFKASLANIAESESGLIMVGYNHAIGGGDPFSIIGTVDVRAGECYETSKGLWARIRLDTDWNPAARQAFKSAQRGLLGLSFMYTVREEKRAKDGANNLIRLDILEITLTPMPANTEAKISATKSRPATVEERWNAINVNHPRRTKMVAEYRAAKANPALAETFAVMADFDRLVLELERKANPASDEAIAYRRKANEAYWELVLWEIHNDETEAAKALADDLAWLDKVDPPARPRAEIEADLADLEAFLHV